MQFLTDSDLGSPLTESDNGSKALAIKLSNAFDALNLYSKKPENMAGIARTFLDVLGEYATIDVMQAFDIWVRRESRFPAPADIVGLIEQNGRPPLSDAMYVNISKKDPCDRTQADWDYMNEYENEKRDGDRGENTLLKLTNDNSLLRKKVHEQADRIRSLYQEIQMLRSELGQKVREVRVKFDDPMVKINNTVEFMRENGCSEEDIQQFKDLEVAKLIKNNTHIEKDLDIDV